MKVTIGGRAVGWAASLGFRWACWRARLSNQAVREAAIGFVIGAALGATGCVALVR